MTANEMRKKLSESRKGKTLSDENRKKMIEMIKKDRLERKQKTV